MKQYEYIFETCDTNDDQVLRAFLNKMGEQGWELVQAEYFTMFNNFECIFKREKSPSPRQTAAIIRHVELKKGRRK